MSAPHLTTIICTHNRAGFVGEAIESVLGQDCPGLQLIVVDDGSTDETAMVVKGFGDRLEYLHQPQSGPAAARNRGFELARGDLIAFLDDDDLWSEDKLALQLPVLDTEPETEIVLGHTQRLLQREGTGEMFEPYREPVKLYSLGAAIFRRSVFERLGLLDENLVHSEDDDWFMRARHHGVKMHFMPEVTLYYRFHGSNMSQDKEASRPYMLRLVKNRLERLRAEGRKP